MTTRVDLFDPDYLQEDLALVDGDLAFDEQGDFQTVQDAANVVASFRRILATPLNALSRFVHDVDPYRLVVTMQNYGNGAYALLSEPLGPGLTLAMRHAIQACADQEERLVLLEVQPRIEPTERGATLAMDVFYRVRGTPDDQFTLMTVNPFTQELELR
jgi:hypothetical protein